MKPTVFGSFLFVLTVYGQTSGIEVKVHIFVDVPMTCSFAQIYCKEFYKNLSIVSTYGDLQKLEEAAGGTYKNSWIDSQGNSCKSLNYEDTQTTAVQYLFENPSVCAFAFKGRWKKTSCSNKYSFFCSENFILVQKNKTWEEALEYCRSHYTDLASFSFDWPTNQIKAQTDTVWTGLRFLDGNWYWLSVKSVQTNIPLPSCPPEPYRCGARNNKKEQWENRDCEEKLNFLCLK